jgi:hypothetical protein
MSLESSHYYDIHGNPCHTQPCVSKNAKKPTRPTTVSDAKKLGLFPSVSAYTRVLANPALDRHKQLEVVKACYNCVPGGGETLEEYGKHILDKSQEDAMGAADLGTQIHAAIEAYLTNPEYDLDDAVITMPDGNVGHASKFVLPAIERMKELNISVLSAEKVLVNAPEGYAGTTDIVGAIDGDPIILDFKSKRTKPNVRVEPYDVHPIQIAAYFKAQWGRPGLGYGDFTTGRGINIFISTTEIGRVEHTIYEEKELRGAWEAFQCCCALYRYTKKFDPRRPNLS